MKHVEKMKQMMMAKAQAKRGDGTSSKGRKTAAPLDYDVACEIIELMMVHKSTSSEIAYYNYLQEIGDEEAQYVELPDFDVRAAVDVCREVFANLRSYKANHRSSYGFVYYTIYQTYDAGKGPGQWFDKQATAGTLLEHYNFLSNLYAEFTGMQEEREAKTYAAKPAEEPKKGCFVIRKADKAMEDAHRVSPDAPDALTSLLHESSDDYVAERTSDVYAEFTAVQELATTEAKSRTRSWWNDDQ